MHAMSICTSASSTKTTTPGCGDPDRCSVPCLVRGPIRRLARVLIATWLDMTGQGTPSTRRDNARDVTEGTLVRLSAISRRRLRIVAFVFVSASLHFRLRSQLLWILLPGATFKPDSGRGSKDTNINRGLGVKRKRFPAKNPTSEADRSPARQCRRTRARTPWCRRSRSGSRTSSCSHTRCAACRCGCGR